MTAPLVSAAVIGFILGLALPQIARPVLTRFQVLDIPNGRSSHTEPVVRGAGIAVGAAMLATTVIIAPSVGPPLLLCVALGSVAGLLGFADDVRTLSVRVRLIAQLTIGVAFGVSLVLTGFGGWYVVLLSVVLCPLYVNVVNFMDGINAVSAFHGAVVGTGLLVIGVLSSLEWLAVVGVLVGVCFAGFIPSNLARHRMFLGDAGSYLLGAMVSGAIIAGIASGVSAVALIAPISIYLTETLFAIVKRAVRHEQWWTPHRTHYYQRLVDAGYGHVATAMFVSAFSAVSAAFGMLTLIDDGLTWLAVLAIIGSAVSYVLVARWQISRQLAGSVS